MPPERGRQVPPRRPGRGRGAARRSYPCPGGGRGRGRSGAPKRRASSSPSRWRVVREPPWTASPAGLSMAITSASRWITRAWIQASSPGAILARGAGAGVSGRGGTRTRSPPSSRSFALARLPSTRTWPSRRRPLQPAVGEPGEAPPKPAVEPEPGFTGIDIVGGDAAHLPPPSAIRPARAPVAELSPIVESLGDLALEAALGRRGRTGGGPWVSGK